MELAMIDDTIVGIEDATVSAHDRGLYFGDGVYEVILWNGGRLFALDRHMRRLENSLRLADMLEKVDVKLIERRVRRAAAEAGLAEAVVYFHITRGRAIRRHDYGDDWRPGFFLTVRSRGSRLPETARAITHPDWRWKRCDIKSLNLLANVLAKRAAVRAGVYEALLVDEAGLITEGTSNSVFLVRGGVLQTAPLTANILAGITRGLLLKWAGDVGLEVREESFGVARAQSAAELLLTGTSTSVMALTELDGVTIADGGMGDYTRRLREKLLQAMCDTTVRSGL